MKPIPQTDDVLVLRTDFKNEIMWKKILEEIQTPNESDGFLPYVEFLSDKEFEGLTREQILTEVSRDYKHSFIFIVDNISMNDKEPSVLCINLRPNHEEYFRVIPSEMWSVENNLSIANMSFYEFVDSVDSDGIFRGFK